MEHNLVKTFQRNTIDDFELWIVIRQTDDDGDDYDDDDDDVDAIGLHHELNMDNCLCLCK